VDQSIGSKRSLLGSLLVLLTQDVHLLPKPWRENLREIELAGETIESWGEIVGGLMLWLLKVAIQFGDSLCLGPVRQMGVADSHSVLRRASVLTAVNLAKDRTPERTTI
jgi:hypothetical protein